MSQEEEKPEVLYWFNPQHNGGIPMPALIDADDGNVGEYKQTPITDKMRSQGFTVCEDQQLAEQQYLEWQEKTRQERSRAKKVDNGGS